MENYKAFLKNEVEEFRKTGHKFLDKEISKAEFKGISGGMGVYAQQDQKSFMIRLRTPSGLVSKAHLKLILSYVQKYGLEKVHLTTRQAVQLHDLEIDSVCDIMKDAIDHDLFTRGGGGNFPRNVSLSPLAGVDKEEAFDVTPYALQVGNYFLGNAPSYKLPRKLKVAFSCSEEDTAAASINDMGFLAVSENGVPMFRMWLAGGMGQGPAVAVPYPALVRPQEVLYYVEAMIQLFIAEGDYENKAKARTRFIPRRMGTEAFLECFEKHLQEVKKTHQFEEIEPVPAEGGSSCEDLNGTCIAQRQEGLYTVILHPVCGQLAAEDLEKITAFVEPIEEAQVRLSMEEEMYVRNLTSGQAQELQNMMAHMMQTPVARTLSCVGTPSCQMGILQSQKLCREILAAVEKAGLCDSRLPMIQISGCPNSCSRHQVAEIGFAGRKVKVGDQSEDAFQLFVGGSVSGADTHMGELQGVMLARVIPQYIVELGTLLEQEEKSVAEIAGCSCFKELTERFLVS